MVRVHERVALTVRLGPETAELVLDGQPAGVGSRTITNVGAGLHHLSARARGYDAMAVVVDVHAPPLLTETSLFLRPQPMQVALASPPQAQIVASPWYERRWPWALVGGVLLTSAVTWAALERREPTVDIVIGRP